jgi:hypothetical protein
MLTLFFRQTSEVTADYASIDYVAWDLVRGDVEARIKKHLKMRSVGVCEAQLHYFVFLLDGV